MMKRLLRAFYMTYIFIKVVSVLGQNLNLEQECHILKTLETLEAKIQLLETFETRIQQLETLEVKIQQLETLEAKIKPLESLAAEVEELKRQEKGKTYTRYGRTSCPGNGSELVYSGFVGGSQYNNAGAAVDYLCLPKDPKFSHYDDTLEEGGFVYGAEYEQHMRSNFPKIDNSAVLPNNNVPCAVCRTKRTDVVMIPARNICYDGWTLEYIGYLTSGRYDHAAASQYVCLDDEPEVLPGGSANDNGKLFYFVEGRCGSLPCPPYTNGRELTCVLCSK